MQEGSQNEHSSILINRLPSFIRRVSDRAQNVFLALHQNTLTCVVQTALGLIIRLHVNFLLANIRSSVVEIGCPRRQNGLHEQLDTVTRIFGIYRDRTLRDCR